ncbi:hypothetical protein GQS65_08635 [Halomarina oriensis]|uniref:Uncharacterized protein n=2 Tax=Halomarina oriensis TaxID=671145 RepID=A0A6B0GIH9_9EURY|nr:hypothetical protein [Halomarina oriensis]
MGWFDFRRSARAMREDTGRLVLLAGGVLFPTLLLAGLAVLFVPELRGSDVDFALGRSARGSFALFWLFGTFMLAQRTTAAHREPVADAFVLTTVSPRTAVVGGVLAESLRALTYALPVGLLVAVATAYAFSAPVSLFVVPLVGGLFVASAVTAGRVLGYTAAWLVATVPWVARHKTALGIGVVVAFFGGYTLLQVPQLPVSVSPALLGVLPVGWLVDLVAVGTPVGWSPGHAVGGVATATTVLLGGGWLAERIATSLWFGEPVDVTDTDDGPPTRPATDRRALERAVGPLGVPVVSGPTRAVTEWTLLRARREPQRLNFLMIPVFGGGSALGNLLLQGSVSLAVLGPVTAVLAAWAVGAAFGLNPFGDEGAVLPSTLTAVSGRAFVRGLVAPSLLFLPVVAVLTLVAAVGGGHGPPVALALTLVACFLTVVGAALAPLVGMWFPRFSAIRIGNSDGVRPPRLLAGALHVALVWVPGAALVGLVVAPELVRLVLSGVGYVPALLLSLVARGGEVAALAATLTGVGETILGLPLPAFRVGVGALLVLGGLLVARAALGRAVRRFDRYEVH